MYIIREVFIAKPGNASKLAKMLKEMDMGTTVRVMTDVTGVFNKVVMETEVASLAEHEKRMEEYKNAKPDPKMQGYTEMYTQGKREIYRVW